MLEILPSWVKKSNISRGSCHDFPHFFWPTAGKEGRSLAETVPKTGVYLGQSKIDGES